MKKKVSIVVKNKEERNKRERKKVYGFRASVYSLRC